MPSIPRPRSARKAAPRRTRVPPALTRGREPMPASGILDEVAGELGVVLWRSVRNVLLWADTPPSRRARLFSPDAAAERDADVRALALDPELVAPLSVMVRLLEAPGEMELGRLVNACRRVSAWAEQHGWLATALEWMQAAALAAPQSAPLAYAVGRIARRRAEYDRAETWLARAVVQARRSGDWRSYALAYSGLGNLNGQKGNYPLARRAHLRCLRAALRHGLEDLQGDAYHDLFVAAIETGTCNDRDALAEEAMNAYGPGHRKLPRLAFDVAYFWIEEGFFGAALRVARALIAHFPEPGERALTLSMIARCAGGVQDSDGFNAARAELDALLASGASRDSEARALLGVAYGAASLARWDSAADYAERALRVATDRREGRLVIASEAAVEVVRTRSATAACEPRPSACRLAQRFVEELTAEPRGREVVAA